MSVTRDAGWMLGAHTVGLLTGLGMTIVAARVLSKEDVGLLAWIATLAFLLGALGSWGSGFASVAHVGQAPAEERGRLVGVLLTQTLLGGVVVAIIWRAFGGAFIAKLDDGDLYARGIMVITCWIPTAALLRAVEGCARGLQAFAIAAFAGEYLRRVAIIAALAFVALDPVALDLEDVLLLVPVLEACVIAVLLLRLRHRVSDVRVSLSSVRQSIAKSTHFVPMTLAALIIPQSGVWLAAIVMPSADVADIAVAIRASFLISIPLFIGNRVFAPRIAAARGELSALESSLREFATLATVITVVVSAAFLIRGRWLLSIAFGAEYRSAWVPLLVLALGQCSIAFTGLSGLSLSYAGHQGLVAMLSIVAILLFIPGALILGAAFGPTGLVAPATVLVGVQGVAQTWFARSRLGINTLPAGRLSVLAGRQSK